MDQSYPPPPAHLPPSATLPPPMHYSRHPPTQFPLPDAAPRPLFDAQVPQHQQHQQPPHPQQQPQSPQQSYSPHPQQLPYAQPPYQNGMPYAHPQSPQYPPGQPIQLPPMSTALVQPYQVPHVMDTTGQVPPPGMRPRLTTSIFEEEGSLCFQVDVNGICVARREDNHMINGTKLLNVAQMTRGRRDGILKAEKQKAVVKIGPMHLKGVWIPFERALALANQEQITERLYPLFVHQIDSLLYHPANAARPVPLPGAYPEEQRMSPLQVQSPLQAHAQPHMSPPQAQPPHGNAQTQPADDDRRPRL